MPIERDELATQVQGLAEEVRVLRQVLGEVRDELCWALRDDRLLVNQAEKGTPRAQSPPVGASTEASPEGEGPRHQATLW